MFLIIIQLILTDSTFNLTEREKRVLEKSWAKTFAETVFPAIDKNIFLFFTVMIVLLHTLKQKLVILVHTKKDVSLYF